MDGADVRHGAVLTEREASLAGDLPQVERSLYWVSSTVTMAPVCRAASVHAPFSPELRRRLDWGAVDAQPTAGLVLVDKPAGPSSFAVVKRLRDAHGTKAGHAGTLDPLATGLLLVLLYMVIYYRALGLVVLFGLGVWGMLMWSIVSYLGETSGLALSLDRSGIRGQDGFAVAWRLFPATGYVPPDRGLTAWALSITLPVVALLVVPRDVPDHQWDDWRWQTQNSIRSVRQLRTLTTPATDASARR